MSNFTVALDYHFCVVVSVEEKIFISHELVLAAEPSAGGRTDPVMSLIYRTQVTEQVLLL